MNKLNSILIEGDVIEAAKDLLNSDGRVIFRIRSDRKVKYAIDEKVTYVDETTVADVITEDNLALMCKEHCVKDQVVRVIGRLMTGGIIFAEHVEIKPTRVKDHHGTDEET